MIKEHHETLPYHWHLTEKVTLITEKYKEDSSRRSKFPPLERMAVEYKL